MKIIISHSERTRQIEGPYNICGRGKDLILLANRILQATKNDPNFFGWVEISETQPMIANTTPSPWDE